MPRVNDRRVAHKSTGGIPPKIPTPVGPVGNAPNHLTPNTVALYGVANTTVLSSIVTAPVPETAPASALPFSLAPLTSVIEVFARMVP